MGERRKGDERERGERMKQETEEERKDRRREKCSVAWDRRRGGEGERE